ncbi:zinc finger BED domain-containing protein RICESLEEPER 2-like [Senna tora]|uniref:Zinc finger BED domain-containing protein RICESLEEPER 2-like n=1 Tax=Senna tora TaxID=362788 RepID=A0A834TQM2_9FABA|nr:zinc finger BED domain-containing protein RICESLEEPER 2-like [Senna tora]
MVDDRASQSIPSEEVDYYGLQEAIGDDEPNECEGEGVEGDAPPTSHEPPPTSNEPDSTSSKRKRNSPLAAVVSAVVAASASETLKGTTVTKKPTRPPSWLCREALARMVIIDELPFRFTVARDCYRLYVTEKNRLNSILVDNASSNDVAIAYLKRRINAWKESLLSCELLHMRCCAYILNLIDMDGLKEVHDSIVKIRNAVRFVRSSHSRVQKFKTCAEDEKIQSKSLVSIDVCTRWNSTYLMLESALKFQLAFDKLEDTCGDYLLNFVGGSERKMGPPSMNNWEIASKFVKFLKIFYEATLHISASTHATSHIYFHDFGTILNALNKWCESDDLIFKSMAKKMKNKFDKYWRNIKNVNLIIFIACVLDPRYKMKFVEFAFAKLYDTSTANALSASVRDTLCRLFDHYCLSFGVSEQNNNLASQTSQSKDDIVNDDNYDISMVFAEEMSKEDRLESKTEVEIYLAEAREKMSDKFDILNWWKVNSSKYLILALITSDVLVVPMSTVASESTFSTRGHVLDPYRSSLSPRMVEALICAQNWYRNSTWPCDMESPDEGRSNFKEVNKVCEGVVDLEI